MDTGTVNIVVLRHLCVETPTPRMTELPEVVKGPMLTKKLGEVCLSLPQEDTAKRSVSPVSWHLDHGFSSFSHYAQ